STSSVNSVIERHPLPSAMGSVRYLSRRQAGRPSSSKSQHIVTAQLQLNVFGPPELVRGGTPGPGAPVGFRTKKPRAVLLDLHFEGRARPIPRDRLVDLLRSEEHTSEL